MTGMWSYLTDDLRIGFKRSDMFAQDIVGDMRKSNRLLMVFSAFSVAASPDADDDLDEYIPEHLMLFLEKVPKDWKVVFVAAEDYPFSEESMALRGLLDHPVPRRPVKPGGVVTSLVPRKVDGSGNGSAVRSDDSVPSKSLSAAESAKGGGKHAATDSEDVHIIALPHFEDPNRSGRFLMWNVTLTKDFDNRENDTISTP